MTRRSESMGKVAVVFWRGAGNTEMTAYKVAQVAVGAGGLAFYALGV